jgi:hypothetical protein
MKKGKRMRRKEERRAQKTKFLLHCLGISGRQRKMKGSELVQSSIQSVHKIFQPRNYKYVSTTTNAYDESMQ